MIHENNVNLDNAYITNLSSTNVCVTTVFKLPVLTADPPHPINGQIYINSQTNDLNFYLNGSWYYIT